MEWLHLHWLQIELISTGKYKLTLGQGLAAVLVFFLSFYVSLVVQRAVNRLASLRGTFQASHIYTLTRFLHYFIVALGIMFALSIIGIDMGKLAIVAGALGIGIGMGLQGLVNNFVSGIVILLEKSLKVGDFIEVSGDVTGVVQAVNMRSTLVRTNDNVDIIIPNSELVGNRVINWTMGETSRRFRIPFSVAYGSDKEVVQTAALEAARNVPYTLDNDNRRPVVWMTGFGDSSLDFLLGVWVEYNEVVRPGAVMSDYLWAIDDAFRKYEIEIPFPQRDIHFRSPALKVVNGSEGADDAVVG